MCGEHGGGFRSPPRVRELPPRTRRIRKPPRRKTNQDGTTSACAENTWLPPCLKPRPRNYLRVRGEYVDFHGNPARIPELPPHARRIRLPGHRHRLVRGTTSACAENTSQLPGGAMLGELPPRARRVHDGCPSSRPCRGTTSAYAENTKH